MLLHQFSVIIIHTADKSSLIIYLNFNIEICFPEITSLNDVIFLENSPIEAHLRALIAIHEVRPHFKDFRELNAYRHIAHN